MKRKEKYIKYQGQIIFGKQTMPHFDRIPKSYLENESCFIFVNQGSISVRTPEKFLDLSKKNVLMGKCVNYFFEMRQEQKNQNKEIEVIAILLFS